MEKIFSFLFKSTRNLQAAEDNMTRLATGLDDVDKQVAVLREQLSVSTREASEIEIGLDKARQTLSVSQNLVHELADEYDRWRLQVNMMLWNCLCGTQSFRFFMALF